MVKRDFKLDPMPSIRKRCFSCHWSGVTDKSFCPMLLIDLDTKDEYVCGQKLVKG